MDGNRATALKPSILDKRTPTGTRDQEDTTASATIGGRASEDTWTAYVRKSKPASR